MRRRSPVVTLAIALAFGPGVLAAQNNEPAPQYLRGVVVDTAGLPLANVQVQRKGKRAVLSGDDGRFAIEVEPKVKLQVELRRIGLHPARYIAALPPDTALTLTMFYKPQVLPEVEARANRIRDLERVGFYSRLEDNKKGTLTGYFLTPEYLDRRNGQRVTQLVENVPGVDVKVGLGGEDSSLLKGLNNCHMNVWIQGVMIKPDSSRVEGQRIRLAWTAKAGNVLGPPGQLPISDPFNLQIDDIIQGSSVSAIEVYPRQNQLPDRFRTLHGNCGAVVIWLKGHDSR